MAAYGKAAAAYGKATYGRYGSRLQSDCMAREGLQGVASALSEIERKALKALADGKAGAAGVEELGKKSSLNIDSARRAVEWLAEKGLVAVSESVRSALVLSASGMDALGAGMPEMRLLSALQKSGGRARLGPVGTAAGLNSEELNAALGIARKNGWVGISKGKESGIELELTGLEKPALAGGYAVGELLKKIGSGGSAGIELGKIGGKEREALKELEKRNLVERKEHAERGIAISRQGQEALALLPKLPGARAYDVQGAVPEIFIGKKQPYMAFLSGVRKKLIELGFQEMETRLVELEFYNFDVLFQPQNHPARSWSDTYALKRPAKGKLPGKEIVERVKAAHENGWKTGSRGWQYKWSEEIACRLMPVAHGTAHSARQMVKGIKSPGKYFAIARCYRPDVVDARHLIEFNQLEGIVIDKELTFRSLLGILEQFAVEIAGAKKVKFTTGYFPFTEPSCELYIEHPKLGWVEVGGAGIFRPELTLPLGIKTPVIAWGLGIDRLAMIKLGIGDIRELFSKNLEWLRSTPIV